MSNCCDVIFQYQRFNKKRSLDNIKFASFCVFSLILYYCIVVLINRRNMNTIFHFRLPFIFKVFHHSCFFEIIVLNMTKAALFFCDYIRMRISKKYDFSKLLKPSSVFSLSIIHVKE